MKIEHSLVDELVRRFRNRDGSQGKMIQVLSQLYNISIDEVAQILRAAGQVDNMPAEGECYDMARQTWTKENEQRLRELAGNGATLAEAADVVGVTIGSAAGKAYKLGVRFEGKRSATRQRVSEPLPQTPTAVTEVLQANAVEAAPVPQSPKVEATDVSTVTHGPIDMLSVVGHMIDIATRLFGRGKVQGCTADGGDSAFIAVYANCAGHEYRLKLEEVHGDG